MLYKVYEGGWGNVRWNGAGQNERNGTDVGKH